MKYQFIYFDLDDTLLDHKSAEQQALKDVHAHFEIFQDIEPENLIDVYHRVNSRQWKLYSRNKLTREQLQRNRFEETLQELNLDSSRYDEIGSYYMQQYREHWQWMDGARNAFEHIRRRHDVGILTNGFAETQHKKFEKFGFYESAKHLVVSEEIGYLKPDPRVFEHATELAGFEPEEILYVGDSYSSDIVGGSNFGWNTAWFTTNGNTKQQNKADFVFKDFSDLNKRLDV